MPENEDSLGLQHFLCLDDVLNKVLAIVVDFSPHVINHEGFSEVVLIISEGHGLKMKSHHGSTLNITKLVLPSCGMSVHIEELSNGSSILWEVWVLSALVPFLVIVNDMVSLRSEQLVQLLILEDCIKDPDFINGGFRSFVSDSGQSHQSEESEMNLPDQSLVQHEETESGISDEGSCPTVIGSIQSGIYLVEIVSSSHSPFLEVVLE